jgi:hypothetical protein
MIYCKLPFTVKNNIVLLILLFMIGKTNIVVAAYDEVDDFECGYDEEFMHAKLTPMSGDKCLLGCWNIGVIFVEAETLFPQDRYLINYSNNQKNAIISNLGDILNSFSAGVGYEKCIVPNAPCGVGSGFDFNIIYLGTSITPYSVSYYGKCDNDLKETIAQGLGFNSLYEILDSLSNETFGNCYYDIQINSECVDTILDLVNSGILVFN